MEVEVRLKGQPGEQPEDWSPAIVNEAVYPLRAESGSEVGHHTIDYIHMFVVGHLS